MGKVLFLIFIVPTAFAFGYIVVMFWGIMWEIIEDLLSEREGK